MAKIRDIIHLKKEKEALKQVINKISGIKDYYIINQTLHIEMDDVLLSTVFPNIVLPNLDLIKDELIHIYSKYEIFLIKDLIYEFNHLRLSSLDLISLNCRLHFYDCEFEGSIDIKDAALVKFDCCDFNKNSIVISADKIILNNSSSYGSKCVHFNTKDMEIFLSNLIGEAGIKLCSDFISIISSTIKTDSLIMEGKMIESEDSKLLATSSIIIHDISNDNIKGVDAPTILYNGEDISLSEGILLPKARERLLSDLKKIRNYVNKNINEEVAEVSRLHKLNLEEKPISKVYYKNSI